MKKQGLSVLVAVTLVFSAFTAGFFLGKNRDQTQITVNVPAAMLVSPTAATEAAQTAEPTEAITFPININEATKEEFMALPGIGEVLAKRILAYREENGAFAVAEELMHVEGIGEKRIEEILDLITIGGPQ